eukprot:CAMPEP_0198238686 /NCGR_PEP_ID=MMETSP1446-20131203/4286_1 /TAXON_ID=1461542 ORGANISM="Unidentified sp, Strain CCMP2111" /NCGR_SAMPLE_ID=MMETSP1446 /ASSEMBLY_ACC=CAM_ASM_001112 /LENGTH=742 /DNA_ID=CAMNT_0043921153 /DNA_START=352 /DNA_END=2578 /DNA_ORIENTATION=+
MVRSSGSLRLVVLLALAVSWQTCCLCSTSKLFITGEGSLMAEFDMVEIQISLAVEVQDDKEAPQDSATLAYQGGAELTSGVLSALETEAGVPRANISTSSVDLSTMRNYSDGSSRIVGYRASTDVTLDVAVSPSDPNATAANDQGASIAQIYAVASSFQEDGSDVNVYGFNPYVSDELRQQYETQLFDMALSNAKSKASTLARGVEMDLGPVLTISDRDIGIESTGGSAGNDFPAEFDSRTSQKALLAAPSTGDATGYPLGKGQKLSKKVFMEYQLVVGVLFPSEGAHLLRFILPRCLRCHACLRRAPQDAAPRTDLTISTLVVIYFSSSLGTRPIRLMDLGVRRSTPACYSSTTLKDIGLDWNWIGIALELDWNWIDWHPDPAPPFRVHAVCPPDREREALFPPSFAGTPAQLGLDDQGMSVSLAPVLDGRDCERMKRQRTQQPHGEDTGGAEGTAPRGGRWDRRVGDVDAAVKELRRCFKRFERIGPDDSDAEVGEIRSGIVQQLKVLAGYHLEMQAGCAAGEREMALKSQLESTLRSLHEILHKSVKALGSRLDCMKIAQEAFLENKVEGKRGWKDVIAQAHKLSFNTFAPANYVPGDPRWGVIGPFIQPVGSATGFFHFSPPAPQKWHFDASLVHDFGYPAKEDASEKEAPEEEEAGSKGEDASTSEDKPAAVPVEPSKEQSVDKEEEKSEEDASKPQSTKPSTMLHHMVDFVLNPDLEVAQHEDYPSDDDAMSTSSD